MPHKDPERRKEYHRKYMVRYRAEHPEKSLLYYWRNLERERARSRAKAKVYRQKKKHDPEWQEKVRLSKKAYGKSATCLAYRKRKWAEVNALISVSAEAYSKHRAKARLYYAFKRVSQHKSYRPNMYTRIHDYAVKGEMLLNASSQWLDVNITPSQRAFAREIAKKRLVTWSSATSPRRDI